MCSLPPAPLALDGPPVMPPPTRLASGRKAPALWNGASEDGKMVGKHFAGYEAGWDGGTGSSSGSGAVSSVGVVVKDGYPFCEMCHNWADEGHLKSKKHRRNLEWWSEEHGLYASENRVERLRARGSFSTTWGTYSPPSLLPPPVPCAATSSFTSTVSHARKCAWCSGVALEKDVEGTRAKYCASCWQWWQNGGAGAGESSTELGTGSYQFHQPIAPPPRHAALPPALPPLPVVPPDDSAAMRRSLAKRWLDEESVPSQEREPS